MESIKIKILIAASIKAKENHVTLYFIQQSLFRLITALVHKKIH